MDHQARDFYRKNPVFRSPLLRVDMATQLHLGSKQLADNGHDLNDGKKIKITVHSLPHSE
jgi:hypothetical protein